MMHQLENNWLIAKKTQMEYYCLLGYVNRYFEEIPQIFDPFNHLNSTLIQTSLFTDYNIK